jgi:hypothetical protein
VNDVSDEQRRTADPEILKEAEAELHAAEVRDERGSTLKQLAQIRENVLMQGRNNVITLRGLWSPTRA